MNALVSELIGLLLDLLQNPEDVSKQERVQAIRAELAQRAPLRSGGQPISEGRTAWADNSR